MQRYTKALERAYTRMWSAHVAGAPPRPIEL
jgi:hypothetical protein